MLQLRSESRDKPGRLYEALDAGPRTWTRDESPCTPISPSSVRKRPNEWKLSYGRSNVECRPTKPRTKMTTSTADDAWRAGR